MTVTRLIARPLLASTFAIGAIMLKRGWMLRYMPAIDRRHQRAEELPRDG